MHKGDKNVHNRRDEKSSGGSGIQRVLLQPGAHSRDTDIRGFVPFTNDEGDTPMDAIPASSENAEREFWHWENSLLFTLHESCGDD